MNCEIDNRTACPTHWHRMSDAHGREAGLLVIKASFRLSTSRLCAAEDQSPVNLMPRHVPVREMPLSEAQRRLLGARVSEQILWEDHDLVPPKPHFNVMVQGFVEVPAGQASDFVATGLKVGDRTVGVKAFGPRYTTQGLLGKEVKRLGNSQDTVPLSYAFSAVDGSVLAPGHGDEDELTLLPWLEPIPARPGEPLAHEAFGVSLCLSNAEHRRQFSGTYDERWRRERAPQLPDDFDPRFWNDASPTLQWTDPLPAGTPLRLANMAPTPLIVSQLPSMNWRVRGFSDTGELQCDVRPRADTLLLTPTADRMTLTWRSLFSTGPAGGLPKRLLIEASA